MSIHILSPEFSRNSTFHVLQETLTRDIPVVVALTVSLFIMGYGFRGRQGRINRIEGAILLAVYIGYTAYLSRSVFIK
ncbi:MAG: hypothetical protein PF482_05500 [Desulfobacteraceae bacterium]|nr:hypothetical protein [Desulfobacteraceae bacterium]